jgi:hypothetical protein
MAVTPRGNETLDFSPFNLPHKYLAAIGLMSATASSTDAIVEMAIAIFLGIDAEQGWAVTAHMSAPQRESVLKSAAEIYLDDPDHLDRLDNLLAAIKTASQARNEMVHGSWCVRPSDKAVMLAKQQARTHVVVQLRPVPIAEIEKKAVALYHSGMDLMDFLLDLGLEPKMPRPRTRGVNTPNACKVRRKKMDA